MGGSGGGVEVRDSPSTCCYFYYCFRFFLLLLLEVACWRLSKKIFTYILWVPWENASLITHERSKYSTTLYGASPTVFSGGGVEHGTKRKPAKKKVR